MNGDRKAPIEKILIDSHEKFERVLNWIQSQRDSMRADKSAGEFEAKQKPGFELLSTIIIFWLGSKPGGVGTPM